ncbi:MAG TPA: cytochrome c3 family protein, partial [Dissulfurispiraceae bacterium]|nr:cytochrome c3 family protein [Dissulfurispiraceae bacterium]
KGGEEMKYLSALLVVIIAVVFVGSAMAVPSGKTVEFAGGGNGKVVFAGKSHADAGLHCNDCHTKIFPMKKTEGVFKMAEMKDGKACGACHNGTKAFSTSDPANCSKCHKK